MRPAYGSPDGHGRYGILDRDDDRRPICHECGRAFERLATHVRVHGISAAEYRERHGLSPGLALVGDATRARMSAAWERHRSTHLTALEEHRDPNAAREASRESRWSPQQVAGAQARGAARPGTHRRRDHLAGRPNRHPGMGRPSPRTARARRRAPLVARSQHRHADPDGRAAPTTAPARQWMTACDHRRPDLPPMSMPSIPGGDQTPYWLSMYSLERSASSAGQPHTVLPSNSFE